MNIASPIPRNLRNALTLTTRATRAEFWSFWALHAGALTVGYVMMLAGNPLTGLRAFMIGLAIYVLTLPFMLIKTVQRFHDVGRSAKTGAALYLLCFTCLALAAWLSLPTLRVDAHLAGVHSDMSGPRESALYAYLSPGIALGTAAHNILGALIFYAAILPLLLIAGLSFALITPTLLRRSDPGVNDWGSNPQEVAS
ncbi:DUF805 domain-containing protein [Halocynthiibacter sp.]|uniref:DUF805 domain-containing protein n=1 Tax=Halocynthiibacter sp. TaxID=1979210 RepID=UPI003C4CCB8A